MTDAKRLAGAVLLGSSVTLRPRQGVGDMAFILCAGSYSRFRPPDGLINEVTLNGVVARSEPTINSSLARP